MSGKENNWFKFFYSRWFFLVFTVLFILTAVGFLKSYYGDYQVRQEIKRLEQEAKELETVKLNSLELLKYVESDDFIKERAHTEFNLRQPEENVAVVLNGTTEKSGGGQKKTSMVELSKTSNPLKWWRLFIK
jgi:cell division protein FtsL